MRHISSGTEEKSKETEDRIQDCRSSGVQNEASDFKSVTRNWKLSHFIHLL
jgi:hypothetical protein